MDNPDLYLETNKAQQNMTVDILNGYGNLIQWNPNGSEEIMDIGCATGDVTNEILFPILPSTVKRLLAIDINPKMIKIAKEKYSKNPKIEFDVLDIAGKIPEVLKNRFDHIFSFFCLHWIQDQKLLYKNIFDLLKPGGNTFFAFIHDCHQVQGNYCKMAKDPKWKNYLSNINQILPPYRHEKNPEELLRKNIENSGLVVEVCKKISNEAHFPNEKIFKDFLESVNPFVKNMPDDVRKEYMTEYFKLVQEGNPTKSTNGPLILHVDFLFAYAQKKV